MSTEGPPHVGLPPGAEAADALAEAALRMARSFAAGATMFCVAPGRPADGRHVAVEFVHPVIVGKRAFPAVHLHGRDVVSSLRTLCRAGDLVLLVAQGTDPSANSLVRRAAARGVVTIWLVTEGSALTPADQVVEVAHLCSTAEPVHPSLPSAELVLCYHLLWELVHVAFEHPGLLDVPAPPRADRCLTCADDGVVVEVTAVDDGSAEVLAGGRREIVDVSLVAEPGPGDLLLVHAGVAIATVECAG